MDEFGNILNNATTEANQTYGTDTANAANAQAQANTASNNVNAEGQNADQQAAKLSSLGDTYSNQAQNESNFNTAEQSQLNTMGFDPTTLNQANQNIAQETGQLGAANNQMAAEGGTRGFNAVGAANRQADVQNQFNNAIAGNTAVQSNALGQANTAATLTGQDMTYQLGQNTNAINAYNSSAQQYNNTMANYATQLNTFATQAVQDGGLVGSNVANIMASANSAAQAALAPYQAQLASAQAGLATSQTKGQNLENAYNAQMQPLQIAAEKQVQTNNNAITTQINALTADINNEKATENSGNTGSGWAHTILDIINPDNIVGRNDPFEPGGSVNSQISGQQSQIQQLKGQMSANIGA